MGKNSSPIKQPLAFIKNEKQNWKKRDEELCIFI